MGNKRAKAKSQADQPTYITEPLSAYRLEDLEFQLHKRIATLFLHHNVYLHPTCSNWNEAVLRLAGALANEHARWLAEAITDDSSSGAWKLAMALARKFVKSFEIEAEKPRRGASRKFKGHEMEIRDTVQLIQTGTDFSEEKICSLLADWPKVDQQQIPENLRGLCEKFNQEIMGDVTGESPDLYRRLKEAKQRMSEEPNQVQQEFAARNGYLSKQVQIILDRIPGSQEKKLNIALLYGMERADQQRQRESNPQAISKNSDAQRLVERPGSLVNEILYHQLKRK